MTQSDRGTERRERGRERRVTRREFARSITSGAGAAGGLAALTAATAVVAADHWNEKPPHVTITSDTAWLEAYVPMLDLTAVPQANRPEILGWRVTSTDPDITTDVGVYAAEYAVQKDWLTLTSHAGDHEWIYVFVDEDTGEVDHVSYAAYHWLRGYVVNPNTYTDETGIHPTFRVADTYHNYIPLPTTPDAGVVKSVSSLGDYESQTGPLYQWLDNGLEVDLYPGAVHNPWLLDRDGPLDAWWSKQSRTNRYLVDTWAFLGFGLGLDIRGADAASLGDANR